MGGNFHMRGGGGYILAANENNGMDPPIFQFGIYVPELGIFPIQQNRRVR